MNIDPKFIILALAFLVLGTVTAETDYNRDFTTLRLFQTETLLKKNNLVTRIPEFLRKYEISFEVYPTKFINEWANVIHFTTSGDKGYFGTRIPGVWFTPSKSQDSNKLYIGNHINGKHDHFIVTEQEFPLNYWIKVRMTQTPINNGYAYSVYVNDVLEYSVANMHPAYYFDVKLYASDPWYSVQPGYIRNLQVSGIRM